MWIWLRSLTTDELLDELCLGVIICCVMVIVTLALLGTNHV